MSSISNVTLLDNNNYKLKDSSIAFGTCSTGASTATKVVTIADTSFELRTGSIIGVKFTTSNTASSVKLNVNSSGAKSIYYNNAVYTGTSQNITGVANCIHYYMYDGTNWCFINYSGNYSTSDTYPSAYCGTAAGTAAKAATCTNYTLTSKSWLHVLIANANTSASALTLNVNSKGAKPIYINGAASSSSNHTLPAGTYLVYYDGTNYYFRTDGKLTADITGNAATADNATAAGKFSSNKTITLTGDATGSASSDGGSGWSIATTVSNATTATNDSGGNVIKDTYVKKAGDTMTGVLTLKGNMYEDARNGALNANNSDIYGVNSIYTADSSGSDAEGIHFYRDETHVDTVYAADGELRFSPNRVLGQQGSKYKVFHEGNLDTAAGYLDGRLYYNTHPEGNGGIIPFIYNDLAFLTKKGGSYSFYTTTSTTFTAATLSGVSAISTSLENAFDASPSYANPNRASTDKCVIDITCHKMFTYSNVFYIDFGNAGWRANSITVLVRNSNTETTYTQKGTISNNTRGHWYCSLSHTSTSNGSTVQGFNQIRIVLTNFSNGSQNRIAQIGLINYGSSGVNETFISRGGCDGIYGDLIPYGNSQALGSASKKWNAIYGALIGNADTATKLAASKTIQTNLDSTSAASFDGSGNVTPGVTGTLGIGNGGTGNTTGTATYATTAADTSNTLYPVGVTSGATTTLKRDTSVTMKGGTVTATTFSGDLSGNASSAGKFNSSRTIQLTGDATGSATGDGSSGWSIATTVSNATTAGNVTGVIAIANGGTGKTTGKDAANVLLNSLDTGSSTPVDADYYISQYVGGGTTTTTYHRRPMSAMWEWIKSKIAAWSKNLTAKGNLGWTSQANDKIPVTNNTLAYWDGRYNATQSNLTYCVKGAFGNLAVKDALTKSDVGLGNVDNTADASKSVASAVTATNDSGGNVIKDTYVKKTGDTMSGTLVISKTQDASGTANNSPALIVGGAATAAHMEIDANEIMAKSNGTSVATLFVNWDGGTTITGGNLETKGAVRVGATGDTAGGCVQQYNSTTQSLDFIFE